MTVHSQSNTTPDTTACGLNMVDVWVDADQTDCVHCLRKRIQTLENAVYELSKQVRYLGWRG